MGIGNITSKLASGAKEVAKTFKETSAPKMKSYVQQTTNGIADKAKDAYGRAAMKIKGNADIVQGKAGTIAIDKATGKVVRYNEKGEKIVDVIEEVIAPKTSKVADDVATKSNQIASEIIEEAPKSLKKQIKHSMSTEHGTKVFTDEKGNLLGSYGYYTRERILPNSFKESLMKETIREADSTIYKSADGLVNEAVNGANAVISTIGEGNGNLAQASAFVFKENGKTHVEKRLDKAAEDLAYKAKKEAADALKAQRKTELQAKYGEKLAKAKAEAAEKQAKIVDEQFKNEALEKLKELSE